MDEVGGIGSSSRFVSRAAATRDVVTTARALSGAVSGSTGVAIRPQRGHQHVGVTGGPVRKLGTPHMSGGVALKRRHAQPPAQVHPVVALHLRGDLPDHPNERADQWRRTPLDHGHQRG